MRRITVSRNTHSIVFTRDGSFLTSVPIRRRVASNSSSRHPTWTGVNMKPGEILDLMRRLTLAVNSDRPGSLLEKIHHEMNAAFTPDSTITKTYETRLKNFKNRRRQGLGYLRADLGRSRAAIPHKMRRASCRAPAALAS